MRAWSVRERCSGSYLRGRRNSGFLYLPFPWKEFVQAGDGKIGDAGKDIGKPRLWVDIVEAACGDDGQHDGGTIGPTLGTGEGPVFPS